MKKRPLRIFENIFENFPLKIVLKIEKSKNRKIEIFEIFKNFEIFFDFGFCSKIKKNQLFLMIFLKVL